ncbi:rhomboid family intramembrane serine protease [Methyloversatilis universalis]|uniref:rhomboid family intramembrane serine protease n=1 Tax=Methyloversatilis universalis TaxID=378211 RepID=UPI000360BAF8|nr:rhomboid family intramembrane serine protease [Methyloversatilis universalis]
MTAAPLPLIDQLTARRPRIPVTFVLIALNLAVFAAMLAGGAGLWHSQNGVQLAWGANFGPATKDGQWWRLGSAMFLHFGLLHLGMNMASLFDGGRLVERMFGPLRFAAIYVLSGLTGNLLSLIAQGDRAVSGGASGAIFGVYGALLAFLWQQRDTLERREFVRLFWGAGLFAAITIVLGLNIPGIDNGAHIGGFIAGLLAGAALVRPLDADTLLGRYRQPLASHGQWLAGSALVALIAVLIIAIPAPRYRWSEEVMARGEISDFIGQDRQLVRRWQTLIGDAQRTGASFDELAGRIESEIAAPYQQGFDDLSELQLSPSAPSAPTLSALRQYAEARRDASRALVDGLRAHDMAAVRDALEAASRAGSAPPSPLPTRPAPPRNR